MSVEAVPPGASIARLGIHTLLSRIAVFASGFAGSLIIARSLGPDGRGEYAVAMLLVILAVQPGFGLDLAQLRLWARYREAPATLVAAGRRVALIAAVLGAATILGVRASGAVDPLDSLGWVDVVLAAALVPLWLDLLLARGIVVMGGRLESVNRGFVAGDWMRTALLAVLAGIGALSVESAIAANALLLVVPRLALRGAMRAVVTSSASSAGAPPMGELARLGAKLFPQFLLMAATLRIDVLLVAAVADLEAAGRYAVAVALAELAWLVPDSLTLAIRARQAGGAEPAAASVTARAVRMNLLLGALMAPAIAVIAGPAATTMFGPGFAGVGGAVWALVPGVLAMAAWRPLNVALGRLAPVGVTAVVAAAALTVDIAGNLLLVPDLGIEGAALAASAAYVVGASGAVLALRRYGDVSPARLVPGAAELGELVAAARSLSPRRAIP